jgi:hypothetical protein
MHVVPAVGLAMPHAGFLKTVRDVPARVVERLD